MIGHRVRQFLEAGRRPDGSDLALAARWLPPPLLTLFEGQHPRDAVHSAAAARWLLARGADAPDLIQAALLHDIGKGPQRRLDRAAFVLAAGARLDGLLASESSRFELRRALSRSRRHAERGAEMLAAAGAREAVVDLVRRHHSEPRGDDMLSLLVEADRST